MNKESSLKLTAFFRTAAITALIVASLATAQAQPSGGPYGPIRQLWTVPLNAGRIFYVAPHGDKNAPGETVAAPATIETAISRAVTGDVIILRGGTYRTGDLLLNQGIIMQPYRDELPVLKGSAVASQWRDLGNGLWVTKWDRLFPSAPESWWQRLRNGKDTPLHRFNDDMVFIDGKFLQSAGFEGELNENSFFIDYSTGLVYIGTDPKDKIIEITSYNVAIHRTTGECHGRPSDGKGPAIRGITFTQYAYRALEFDGKNPEGISPESEHGKDIVGTTLEHCTISFCSRVAAYLRGDRLTIRNCRVSDTSTEGIYILSSSDVLLEKNIFTRNNIERISGYYPAAVKIFNQCYRVTCNDNLVTDLPFSNGIWYDVGNVDAVFTNNWVENVGLTGRAVSYLQTWPSESGFFFEISKGAICAGNVFVNCELGIHILNSCDAKMYNNTLVNSTACVSRSERSAVGDHFGWHPATGPDVDERDGHIFVNNLMVADATLNRPHLFVWQRSMLCDRLRDPQFSIIDNNVYVKNGERKAMPLILWSPASEENCIAALGSPAEITARHPGFETMSLLMTDNTVFMSPELKNFRLLPAFTGNSSAANLPAEIKSLLKMKKNTLPYVGAYPRVF
ncbi:MAG: right-handed parallel beta-helix repeat-containing protein [Bacteroidales bacterium]|jgi:parallel beta-helix repeat protein|nr:right-handed parallel beta-helix repeat-containing protein [Bacteroidales bacterium]